MTNQNNAVELNDESLDDVNGGLIGLLKDAAPSEAQGLNKVGAGTLTLSGANSASRGSGGGGGAGKVSVSDLHFTTK